MSEEHSEKATTGKLAAVGILVVIALYVVALIMGLPQKGTALKVEHEAHAEAATPAEGETTPAPEGEAAAPATEEAAPAEGEAVAPAEGEAAPAEAEAAAPAEAKAAEHGDAGERPLPPLYMVTPFVLLLLAIAILPLLPGVSEWWESNLHRFYVAAILGVITLLYYGFMYPAVLDIHWPMHSVCSDTPVGRMSAVFINAILDEFIPFIVLLFALFSIAGGIRIAGNLKAKPIVNTVFIAIGAALASFIGTTGAAMLLIRPLLETNKERKIKAHTVIFFIFAVCNCGGCLLPTGDPPLFLGYLSGVGFLWTCCLWKEWLFVNVLLLLIYYVWDAFIAYPREEKVDIAEDVATAGHLKFQGMFPNVILLIGVILAVALLDPSKAVPGTNWHAPIYLREIVQLALVWISLTLGNKEVRLANRFNFGAITEVAALFFGIFLCMQVPLQILNANGGKLGMGLEDTHAFFWATGSLSSVLDNAPTYVVFQTVAKTATGDNARDGKIVTYKTGDVAGKEAAQKKADELNAGKAEGDPGWIKAVETEAGVASRLLAAVSLGAVFMGAMTYIGNGPNFMVKAIAEEEGIKMPSFFGYMVYSLCILLPLFLVMTFVFL